MSDYFTVKANNKFGYESKCKLGIGNDWRYTRREEAEYLAAFDAGFQTNIPAALHYHSTFYRFPFPWEDAANHSMEEVVCRIHQRGRETHALLPAPVGLLTAKDPSGDIFVLQRLI